MNGGDYRVAVAVDQPEQVEQLMRTARDLASEHGGDVLVERVDATAAGVERLLVPAGDDPHTGLAAGTARAIARANDARVDVVRVVPPDASDTERAAARDLTADVADSLGDVVGDVSVVEGEDAVETLVSAAEDRDVTSIGGGRGGWLRRRVVGSTSRRVGRRARTTVIVANRARPQPRSWLARLRGIAGL